jgi:hypothetical protein
MAPNDDGRVFLGPNDDVVGPPWPRRWPHGSNDGPDDGDGLLRTAPATALPADEKINVVPVHAYEHIGIVRAHTDPTSSGVVPTQADPTSSGIVPAHADPTSSGVVPTGREEITGDDGRRCNEGSKGRER